MREFKNGNQQPMRKDLFIISHTVICINFPTAVNSPFISHTITTLCSEKNTHSQFLSYLNE